MSRKGTGSREAAKPSVTYRFIGGELCLDFVNTVGGWLVRPGRTGRGPGAIDAYADQPVDERLRDLDDVTLWAREAGALPSEPLRRLRARALAHGSDAAAVHARAIALRRSLNCIFQAAMAGREPDASDLAQLNRALADARAHQGLHYADGDFSFDWIDPDQHLESVLWPVALSAAGLLSSDRLGRVKRCPGDRCGWLFVDTSRSGRRRWCDMADCGNVAKVRRYRRRRANG